MPWPVKGLESTVSGIAYASTFRGPAGGGIIITIIIIIDIVVIIVIVIIISVIVIIISAAGPAGGAIGRCVEPWSLAAFQVWFRVSGWFRSHPYNVGGGFEKVQGVSGCFRVGD